MTTLPLNQLTLSEPQLNSSMSVILGILILVLDQVNVSLQESGVDLLQTV